MRSKCVNVAEKLDFQGIEGIGYMTGKPRKVSQNTAIQWYKVVRKVVRMSGKHEMIMTLEKIMCSLFIMLKIVV